MSSTSNHSWLFLVTSLINLLIKETGGRPLSLGSAYSIGVPDVRRATGLGLQQIEEEQQRVAFSQDINQQEEKSSIIVKSQDSGKQSVTVSSDSSPFPSAISTNSPVISQISRTSNLGVINGQQLSVSFPSDSSSAVVVQDEVDGVKQSSSTIGVKTGNDEQQVSPKVSVGASQQVQFNVVIDDQPQTMVLVEQASEPVMTITLQDVFRQFITDKGEDRDQESEEQGSVDDSIFIRSADLQSDPDYLTCPDQSIAENHCPYDDSQYNSQNVTDFYHLLAGTCNHFEFNGYISHPSSISSSTTPHLGCCDKLRAMWENQEDKKVLTYCSCNRNFKCNDNFAVLGPKQGSDLADLFLGCNIPLDVSSVKC